MITPCPLGCDLIPLFTASVVAANVNFFFFFLFFHGFRKCTNFYVFDIAMVVEDVKNRV